MVALFHDLLLRSYLYHCVWTVITAHNLTPEKRDNNLVALVTARRLHNNTLECLSPSGEWS